jgi:hypothetical protein
MLGFKLRPFVAKVAIESEGPSIADRFMEVMVRISLEYDLSPDVWAAAEDVLRALRARGKNRAGTDREAVLPSTPRLPRLLNRSEALITLRSSHISILSDRAASGY